MAILRRSIDLEAARALQEELAQRVRIEPLKGKVELVAGLDAAYLDSTGIGAAVVMSWPDMEMVEERWVEAEVSFPYIPGYLSFREVPLLEKAFLELRHRPQLIFVDGQGIAHPRGIGLASHLGVVLDCPSIGCAKQPLVGREVGEPAHRRGAILPLRYRGRVVGVALRTKPGVKPVYVSPGYGIDLEGSWRMALAAAKGYRLPEPIRRAHQLAQRAKAFVRQGARQLRGPTQRR